jgi:hypothetical protein
MVKSEINSEKSASDFENLTTYLSRFKIESLFLTSEITFTMSDFPSYHHLSSSQIGQLTFNVTIRCIRNGRSDVFGDACSIDDSKNNCSHEESGPLITRQVRWQEKIARPSNIDFPKDEGKGRPITTFLTCFSCGNNCEPSPPSCDFHVYKRGCCFVETRSNAI